MPAAGAPGRWLPLALACFLTSARACTVYDLYASGLAINLFHVISAVGLMADNGTFFVNNRHFPYKCSDDGGMHDWFDNNVTTKWTQEAADADPGAPCRRLNTVYTLKWFHSDSARQPDAYEKLHQLVMPQVWRYRPEVQASVDAVVAQLSLQAQPTIGFHIRGGDKLLEDKITPWPTARACVLVGDDQALLREAEALAVERLGCKLFTGRAAYEMSAHMQGASNAMQHDQRCRASLHLLTDMELLSHTDYFVGSYMSGLPQLIDKLRYVLYGKHPRTTIDAFAEKKDWYAPIRAYLDEDRRDHEYCFHPKLHRTEN